jgi:PIN domain nuclease of toxin-antitoxin system
MKQQYLLDTHTFLWATKDSAIVNLSKQAKLVLEDIESELFVSSVSLYEIIYKYRRGKLPEYPQIAENIYEALSGLEAKELALQWNHAELAANFNWLHGDPFDRMIAAQAKIEKMTLITCDKAFESAPDVKILW